MQEIPIPYAGFSPEFPSFELRILTIIDLSTKTNTLMKMLVNIFKKL